MKGLELFDSEQDAQANLGLGDYIEYRQGVDTKCEDYCMVNAFCPYWQQRLKEMGL